MSHQGTSKGQSSAQGRAWSSGRVLTQEQRERKREVNRSTARLLKKDVQERLAQLESQVSELQQWKEDILPKLDAVNRDAAPETKTQSPLNPGIFSDGGNAVDVNAPWQTSPFDQTYGAADTSGITSSQRMTSTWFGPNPSMDQINHAQSYQRNTPQDYLDSFSQHSMTSEASADLQGNNEDMTSSMSPNVNIFPPSEAAATPAVQTEEGTLDPFTIHTTSTSQAVSVIPTAPPLSTITPQGRDVTNYLNSLVIYIRSLNPALVCFDDKRNQDFLIRAVFQGWDRILAAQQNTCPLWLLLRQVDLFLFQNCNILERIAMLRTVHVKMTSECVDAATSKDFLPSWYKPRPAQNIFGHDPVVDHIAWPGMRDKLTMNENNTLTNRFWAIFAREFRFGWSNGPLEAFRLDPGTNYYSLSDDYSQALTDLFHWRMNTKFCNFFPEFSGDILPADYMPLQMILPSNADQSSFSANAISNNQTVGYEKQSSAEANEEDDPVRFSTVPDPG